MFRKLSTFKFPFQKHALRRFSTSEPKVQSRTVRIWRGVLYGTFAVLTIVNGINWYLNTDGFKDKFIKQLLDARGPNDRNTIHADGSEIHEKFQRIATRVIAGASESKSQLQSFTARVEERIKSGQDEKAKVQYAMMREARSSLSKDWKVVVSNQAQPFVFLAFICSNRIIASEGVLSVHPTDDELGLLISRELAHHLMGHTIMKVFDHMGNLPKDARAVFFCRYSEEQEILADALGLDIAAAAGFNIKQGAEVFNKLSTLSDASSLWHWDARARYDNLLSLLIGQE